MSTRIPAYDDAVGRVYDPHQLGRMETVVRDVLPVAIAESVINDEAWTHVAGRLAAHEANGVDVRAALADVVGPGDVVAESTIDSCAQVYHYRLGVPARPDVESLILAWIAPVPTDIRRDGDEVRGWLHTQARLIQERADTLIGDARSRPELWLMNLRSCPADPVQQRLWQRNVGNIVAYRDLHQIRDPESPLGYARTESDS
ncbi:hypothetical protein [Cryobacterium sp. Y11]|uniref:hypothetical protein n=1 Tax=Cryobacterium sp. Y11 TaxID=2045016 RepID=UPI000CE54B6A|nr:hypothetical protein [Cryobacterium sp. Y11]